MKKISVSVLILLLAALVLPACGRSSYTLRDFPKELKIDADSLSEDTDNLLPVDETAQLLAALPKEKLYVYALDPKVVTGVLVKFDGLVQYFPWRFDPRLAQPDLFVADYNADGKKDVAFTYVFSAGVHARRETLHVLLREEDRLSDNLYTGEKAAVEASRHLSVIADADNPDTFKAYLDGEGRTFKLPGHGEFADLYFDEVQDFTLGDTITLRVEPGIVFRNEGEAVYDVLHYTAQIEFVDSLLTQTNVKLDLNA